MFQALRMRPRVGPFLAVTAAGRFHVRYIAAFVLSMLSLASAVNADSQVGSQSPIGMGPNSHQVEVRLAIPPKGSQSNGRSFVLFYAVIRNVAESPGPFEIACNVNNEGRVHVLRATLRLPAVGASVRTAMRVAEASRDLLGNIADSVECGLRRKGSHDFLSSLRENNVYLKVASRVDLSWSAGHPIQVFDCTTGSAPVAGEPVCARLNILAAGFPEWTREVSATLDGHKKRRSLAWDPVDGTRPSGWTIRLGLLRAGSHYLHCVLLPADPVLERRTDNNAASLRFEVVPVARLPHHPLTLEMGAVYFRPWAPSCDSQYCGTYGYQVDAVIRHASTESVYRTEVVCTADNFVPPSRAPTISGLRFVSTTPPGAPFGGPRPKLIAEVRSNGQWGAAPHELVLDGDYHFVCVARVSWPSRGFDPVSTEVDLHIAREPPR